MKTFGLHLDGSGEARPKNELALILRPGYVNKKAFSLPLTGAACSTNLLRNLLTQKGCAVGFR